MRVWSPTLQPYQLTSAGWGMDTPEPSSTSGAITDRLLCKGNSYGVLFVRRRRGCGGGAGGGGPPFVFEIDEAEVAPRRHDRERIRAGVQVERPQPLRIENPGGDR